jgi:YHS domain-containing protein
VQDPEKYLAPIHVALRDPVNGRPAPLDSTLRVRVGVDFFYFAGAGTRDRFARDPARWARTLSDPVTLVRFTPSSRSPRTTWQGRLYMFGSDSTATTFRAMPDSFATRRGM